jgi:hypothetical protein
MRRIIALAGLGSVVLAATSRLGSDYSWDAGPAISALARGDVHGFVSAPAQMGPASLFLRAPLAVLAGPDSIWAYRLGALVCMLALVALGALLARRAGATAGLAAGLLLVLNPVVLDALHLGHPEELLGAALCVAAVLLVRERPVAGAIALGAALATKQWALIAVFPVLAAAPQGGRMRVALTAAGAAAAVIVPFALADPHAFVSALHNPVLGVSSLRNGNIWGFVAVSRDVSLGGTDVATVYAAPGWLQDIAHPAVAVLTLGLGALALRRRALDPLALLAFLMLLRCALDPWDHAYYHAPFLAALIAWEVLEARRVPLVAALSAAWLGIVFKLHLPLSDLLYTLWALPSAMWLARRALRLAPLRASVVRVRTAH